MANFDPDDWDTHWSQAEKAASMNPAQAFRHHLVTRMVANYRPDSLVDIGCGQGDFLQHMSTQLPNIRLTGLELSEAGTAITKRKVPSAAVLQANLLSQEFNPHSVQGSEMGTCIEVLEHLDNPEAFLRQAARTIRSNGYLIVTVPSGPRTAFDKHIGHRRHYNRATLRELLVRSGFDEVKVQRCGWPFFNLYRLMVFLRGKRLIQDVESQSINSSRVANLIAWAFMVLFKANLPLRIVGWQMVAVCRIP